MTGIAYSVLQFTPTDFGGMPDITAMIRGLKVHEPRRDLDMWATRIFPSIHSTVSISSKDGSLQKFADC